MDLSVIIVSYNTRNLTEACLRSLLAETRGLEFEVLVIDNASEDGSAAMIAEKFPEVRLLAEERNLGFAGANNRAAEEARGDFLLLLNPDTEILDGAVGELHRFMTAHPEVGACGGRTLFADKSLNPTSCWRRSTLWSLFCRAAGLRSLFPGSRLFDPEAMGHWARDTRREVDVITGCLMAVPRALWEELEGFDPRFFMYAEDTDLSLRIRAAGRQLWVIPEATIIHHGGASERVRAEKIVRLFSADMQLYRKHGSPARARLSALLFDLWALSRRTAYGFLTLFSRRYREGRETWRGVWRRRAAWRKDPEPPSTAVGETPSRHRGTC